LNASDVDPSSHYPPTEPWHIVVGRIAATALRQIQKRH
jgi:hypothetical protein